jgi:hypothetical protein
MERTVRAIAGCNLSTVDRSRCNREAIADNAVVGEGLFMRALRRATRRRGIEVPFFEHDLLAELAGRPIAPLGLP